MAACLQNGISITDLSIHSGFIEWDGGKVKIIDHFHRVDFLDRIWRGGTATFSISTLGYDSIASWQVFSFLVDLGPLYALWILESYRVADTWTPAYFPTIFSLAGQFLGIGPVAPLFFFLCIPFHLPASNLALSRTVWHKSSIPLLPIVLLLHTSEVLAMFLAPDLSTRHFWTWAWQLTPLWIGLSNVVAERVFRLVGVSPSKKWPISSSPKLMLVVLGMISSSVWVYTLLFSPHSLSTVFIPQGGAQSGFSPHTRKALQVDELGAFSGTFLWLVYGFFDLYTAGLVGYEWIYYVAALPIVTLCVGPGTACLTGWYMRERIIGSKMLKS
ncbi:hypothetical protein F5B20DRAFT_589879 [Whalleya microplaca]|nr:hypothetical protein F5B20DRAFT_589879 [Whalleya microplaca]